MVYFHDNNLTFVLTLYYTTDSSTFVQRVEVETSLNTDNTIREIEVFFTVSIPYTCCLQYTQLFIK